MYCKSCNKFFNPRRVFHELLTKRTIYLCQDCLNQIIIKLDTEIIPLDNGLNLKVLHIYDNLNLALIDYLVKEYSKIVNKFLKKKIFFILEDKFNMQKLNIYNVIAKLEQSDLLIISFI